LLFCRKGTLKVKKRIDTSWFEHKRLKHSEKPQMFRDLIVEVSGDLSRIELFARQRDPEENWVVWGNEV
jgi:N6-adenosine-specific RNA methylase IME4